MLPSVCPDVEANVKRRAKRTYIRLAAFFAAQPPRLECLVMHLRDIEEVLGERLPAHAAYPFWWSNDASNVHSRAWLSSGWRVAKMDPDSKRVTFVKESA